MNNILTKIPKRWVHPHRFFSRKSIDYLDLNIGHPNVTNTSLIEQPVTKVNTIVNFGRQGHSYMIERFGKLHKKQNAGIFFTIPFFEQIKEIDLREQVIDVRHLYAYTSDNVRIQVAAQLFITIVDPEKACYKVTQPLVAIVSGAQSCMRAAIGNHNLDVLLSNRNILNKNIQEALESTSENWGLVVNRFEITDLSPEETVKRAMEEQSTAERKRRGQVIEAEGKKKAMELEAEGKKRAMELEAHGKKIQIEVAALAANQAAESLSKVPDKVLNYNIQVEYMKLMSDVVGKGKHSSFFLPTSIGTLPSLADAMTRGKNESS